MNVTISHHLILLLLAIIVQAVVFLAYAVPFGLPKPEAWAMFALLLFMGSFL